MGWLFLPLSVEAERKIINLLCMHMPKQSLGLHKQHIFQTLWEYWWNHIVAGKKYSSHCCDSGGLFEETNICISLWKLGILLVWSKHTKRRREYRWSCFKWLQSCPSSAEKESPASDGSLKKLNTAAPQGAFVVGMNDWQYKQNDPSCTSFCNSAFLLPSLDFCDLKHAIQPFLVRFRNWQKYQQAVFRKSLDHRYQVTWH